ncbi:DNA/RNA polymerase [Lindgomyces ingoldianus]|uniref:DNA/RNA polymerase n=1 Tax=Lindgomyces ingoldianus TaxID=673940 RepID=A0ACB6QNL4_9PLEO|nr:DNA/RNA polymerase [Lindgomyces ingoldianus]KAF2467692.1 DNA/RNA polymerase [Lindgomyces ingoldianus]
MLARAAAARRKLRRDALTNPGRIRIREQLTLPWLCPAQMRWAASVVSVTANHSHDSRKQRLSTALSSRQETRSLATAADLQPSPYDAIPFHGIVPQWGSRPPSPETSRLQPWDPSRPLIINGSVAAAPQLRVRMGIGGDPAELHQNLHACIRVGRIDRATAIVQRLTDMYSPSAPEVVGAHNVYLRALFELAEQNPSKTAMADIEAWYNTEMMGKGVEPDAQTFVTILRASMNFLEGGKRESSILKYLDSARECGPAVFEGVNSSPEFSDEEWDTLIRFQPEVYDEPPPVEELQDIQISTPAGRAIAIQHGLIRDDSLQVKPVEQKGLGLSSLKSALAMFEPGKGIPYPHEMEGSQEEKDRAYAYMKQIKLEEDSSLAATERWKAEDAKLAEMGIHGVLQSKPVQALMWHWYSALLPLLQKEMKVIKEVLSNPSKANQLDDRQIYGAYLEGCSVEKMAAVTVQRTITSCVQMGREDTNNLRIASLALNIGGDIEDDINTGIKQRQKLVMRKQRTQIRQELLTKLSKNKVNLNAIGESSRPSLDTIQHKDFPLHVRTKIGAMVIQKFVQSAMITVSCEDPKTGKQLTRTQPAFSHTTGFQNGKKCAWIVPHHKVMEKLRKESVHNISTVKLPMLVEPKHWVGFEDGGYYTLNEKCVRIKAKDEMQMAYTVSAIENGDMKKVLAGLDTLGKVPWNINADVFRVMVHAWNAGEDVGGLVPEVLKITPPQEPSADAPFDQRMKWVNKLKEYENEKAGFHSQRCFQNFQLEVAKAYLNERFFFPHSIDFRGRAYPIPPLLNHIGSDLPRGLLRFANGKELGTVGLQWLKVHLANLYGYDKASLKDREQFAMNNLNEVYDSATNPLNGRRWWAKAEDPWQCLACCIELKNALDSPDPTRFISHLPVHQDGTCNGLQHYAALGGDQAGASQVNLEPSDRPQDIYTGVAELVKEIVAEDAAAGNPIAKFIDGKVSRKVVKRTVMTNVYGVTFIGAKAQVHDELRQLIPVFEETPGVPSLNHVSMYVAKKIFQALGKIFNGAQEIQFWLGKCADRITTSITAEQVRRIQDRFEGKSQGFDPKYKYAKKLTEAAQKKLVKDMSEFKSSVIWTTPLKMPVVQPYRKEKLVQVKTSLQNISLQKSSPSSSVSKRKQLQAFPPNFIHSLDATHMILSALKCNEMGLDFAAVHDSFWTHAADIPNLNTILRDAFVRMHSEDIVSRLAAEFKARYAGSYYRAEISSLSPAGKAITKWRALQRAGIGRVKEGRSGTAKVEEVALEARRRELLGSEDEGKRREGAEMVTPTSIWEEWKDKEAGGKKLEGVKKEVLGAEVEMKSTSLAESTTNAEHELFKDDAAVEDLTTCPEAHKSSRKLSAHPQGQTQNDTSAEQLQPQQPPAKAKLRQLSKIQVWLPLTFPPVPKKGNFDVKRLKESKYFFS